MRDIQYIVRPFVYGTKMIKQGTSEDTARENVPVQVRAAQKGESFLGPSS